MTVNSNVTDKRFVPNGVAFTVDCPGLMVATADAVVVKQYDANGNEVAVPTYTVAGVGDPAGITVTNDGNVPWTNDATGVVVVTRASEPLQQTDPEDFKSEPAEVLGGTFDLAILLIQEALRGRDRSIRLHPRDDGILGELPALDLLKGKVLGFTDAGVLTGLANVPLAPAVAVSGLMQLLLTDGTAAAALTRLGFSGFIEGLRAAADAAAFRAALGIDSSLAVAAPQGRLSLFTAEPVMTVARLAKTVIYYTPYVGQLVPLWNGASFTMAIVAELTNDTTQAAVNKAGPAIVGNNLNYDLFVWDDAGTKRLTRGPAWATDVTRGVGAGTTELEKVQGVWLNKVAIVNGPAVRAGTYVGSVRSNGTATIDWNPQPAAAVGGGNAMLGVFNAYQRVRVAALSLESTVSWQYNVANVWRAMVASNSNRISYIDGLGEEPVVARLDGFYSGPTQHFYGINRDSIVATPASVGSVHNSNATIASAGAFGPSLGWHYLQAMEADSGGAVSTCFGLGLLNAVGPVQANNFAADLRL